MKIAQCPADTNAIAFASGATPSVFPGYLVFFHFILCSGVFMAIERFFMSELNVNN